MKVKGVIQLGVVAVRLEMRAEAGRLSERSSAVLALIWLLSRVQSLVAAQRRGLAESPEAVLALVRTFPRVYPRMGPQASLRTEKSLALHALPPRPVLCPDKHAVEKCAFLSSSSSTSSSTSTSSSGAAPCDGCGGAGRIGTRRPQNESFS